MSRIGKKPVPVPNGVTVLPSFNVTVTPLGTAIGAFPIRDMLSLPYQTRARSSPPVRA